MAERAGEVFCDCARLRGEEVECECGVDCAVCWPWAHEPIDPSEIKNAKTYESMKELIRDLES